MHRVEVVDQSLHRLVGRVVRLLERGLAGVGHRLGDDVRGQAARDEVFGERRVERGRRVEPGGLAGLGGGGLDLGLHRLGGGRLDAVRREERERFGQVHAEALGVGLGDSGREAAVELRDGLAAVLVVLVGLDRDARQRRVGTDVVRLAQVAVAGREAALEELQEVDLAARHRERVEVEVVDVDPALAVSLGLLGAEEELLVVLLGRRRAVLQHRAHRGVAVDVRVVALEVALLRVAGRDLVEDVHQLRVLLARPGAVGAVEDVALGDVFEAGAHERHFDRVLDLLDRGDLVGILFVEDRVDVLADFAGLFAAAAARGLHRLGDGVDNLGFVVGDNASVALQDLADHCGKGCGCARRPRLAARAGCRVVGFDRVITHTRAGNGTGPRDVARYPKRPIPNGLATLFSSFRPARLRGVGSKVCPAR